MVSADNQATMPNFNIEGGTDADAVTGPSLAPTLSAETLLSLDVTPACAPDNYDDRSRGRTANSLALDKIHPNPLPPINQLPPDVLSTIFKLVKGEITRTYVHPVRRRLSWMAPTKVCRLWRAVALDTTSLWSTLDFIKPEIAELMLRRSKSALLNTQPTVVSFRSVPIVREALSYTHRWLAINLGATTAKFESVLSACTRSAPFLEELILFVPQYGNARLPHNFLKDGTPSLKTLRLSGFDLASSWKNIPFTVTITDLSLERRCTGTRPTVQEFSDAMKRMPFLRRLHLQGVLPLPNPPSSLNKDGRFETFPSITEINVSDQGLAVEHFASHFSFPNRTNLTVSLNDLVESLDSTIRDIGTLTKFLESGAHSPLPVGPKLYLHSLAIEDDGNERISSRHLGYGLTLQRGWSDDESENKSIKVYYDPPDCRPEHVLHAIHARFDMSGLCSLEVSYGEGLPQSVWQTAFVYLKKLAIIHFNDTPSTFRAFFAVLNQDPSLPMRSETPAHCNIHTAQAPSYCPGLATIKLSRIQFERGDVSLLGEGLKQRPASWPRLKVQIEKCGGFDLDDYRRLRMTAPTHTVSWDGQPE